MGRDKVDRRRKEEREKKMEESREDGENKSWWREVKRGRRVTKRGRK